MMLKAFLSTTMSMTYNLLFTVQLLVCRVKISMHACIGRSAIRQQRASFVGLSRHVHSKFTWHCWASQLCVQGMSANSGTEKILFLFCPFASLPEYWNYGLNDKH